MGGHASRTCPVGCHRSQEDQEEIAEPDEDGIDGHRDADAAPS
jgi:hypothetical protein